MRVLKTFASFFEAEMRAGRIRRHDPEVVARAFLGSLSHFVFIETLYRLSDELPLAAEPFVRGLIGLTWVGLEPPEDTYVRS